MSSVYNLILTVIRSRYLIQVMSAREVKLRYMGSALGLFWAVLHPLVMVVVYWFIFSLGLKMQPAGDIPFVVWFFCAFIPWTTFNEMVMSVTPSIVSNSALIKRTLFPSEIFPFIHIVSSSFGHIIMLDILVFLMLFNDIPITIYALQFLYYWFAMMCFMVGMGWLTSAMNVISRDVSQVMGLVMQIWFWATPIIWGLELLPERFHFFLKMNPMYYIVQGYRNSFIYQVPFWNDLETGMYFWGQTVILFLLGSFIFQKFKSEFADVL